MESDLPVIKDIIVDEKIFIIRGIQVMIFQTMLRDYALLHDKDLAELYQVETRVLNQAVKRNVKNFPNDFMFELTNSETSELITKCDNLQKLKFNPSKVKVFTEQGISMLSSVLRSDIAIDINMKIMDILTQLIKRQDEQQLLKPSKTDGKIGFKK